MEDKQTIINKIRKKQITNKYAYAKLYMSDIFKEWYIKYIFPVNKVALTSTC